MSVHSSYYLRAKGRLGGEMIVVVKCRGEEAGNMLLRRTRRSAHNKFFFLSGFWRFIKDESVSQNDT